MRHVVEQDVLNLKEHGPSEEYVNKTRENFLKNRQENVITNSFWQQSLMSYYLDNKDMVTEYEKIVKEITPASVKEFITAFLGQGNFIDISMNPAR